MLNVTYVSWRSYVSAREKTKLLWANKKPASEN